MMQLPARRTLLVLALRAAHAAFSEDSPVELTAALLKTYSRRANRAASRVMGYPVSALDLAEEAERLSGSLFHFSYQELADRLERA